MLQVNRARMKCAFFILRGTKIHLKQVKHFWKCVIELDDTF